MLKNTVQFQRQRKQQEEINEITKKIPITKSKKEKEEEILSLMKGIKEKEEKILPLMEAIKNLSENTEKTREQKNILNEMLAMYKEKENELIRDKSALESKLGEIVNHSDKGPSDLIQTQNSSKTCLLEELPTHKMQQDAKIQKNQVKQTSTPPGLGVTDELAKKIAKRRALLDGQNNINTVNVSYSKEAEQSLNKPINKKNIQNQHSQTLKQALNSDNSVPINPGSNMTEELATVLAERNKISERKNNDTTEKEKVISSTTNVSPDEQSKLSERAAVEVQLEQKNADNIAASDQTQNSDEDSFLLQQLKSARDQLINNQTTGQEDNLPSWVKSEFIDSALEKKLLEEKKEQDLFNFLEIVSNRIDLSEKETQEIINFREQVDDVELRFKDEAYKKRFESTVSKIVEEISRPNSILDDEFFNNLKTINDFIKENPTQQQPQTLLSKQFKPHNKHEAVIVEMTPKLRR